MTSTASPHPPQAAPPPAPAPSRRNAVLRLFDAPLHRDWCFWSTVGWGALMALSLATSEPAEEPGALPVWLDTVLATAFAMALLGLLPAWLRLTLRRWRWRRRQRSLPAWPAPGEPRARAAAPHPPHGPTRRTRTGVRPTGRRPAPAGPGPAAPPRGPRPPHPQPHPQPHQPLRPEPAAPARRAPAAAGPGLAPSAPPPPAPARADDPLAEAAATFPHPVARFARRLQLAHGARERHEALLDTAEALAVVLGVTAAGLLRARAEDDATPPGPLAALSAACLRGGGLTFGGWTHFLERLARDANAGPGEPPPGLAALPETLRHGAPLAALHRLRRERNDWAHGGRPRAEGEAAARVADLLPTLVEALAASRPLAQLPWLYVESTSYSPRERVFHVTAFAIAGSHPDFERERFTWARPVGDHTFQLLTGQGPVSLAPFVARPFCPRCQAPEICYAQRAPRAGGPATLRSFDRGHEIPDEEAGVELRELAGRRQPG
ncbi:MULTISPECIES: hypothetical protein [Streptomyces]|uniref:hypothetical protein n=1 Tax=Streptomyces TaxID=1883 RepID=UPI00186B400C|nr:MULTISPECIES: hypothetical protein [Streptomyces]